MLFIKCDYHIVWVPKYRLRILTEAIRDLVDHDILNPFSFSGILKMLFFSLTRQIIQA